MWSVIKILSIKILSLFFFFFFLVWAQSPSIGEGKSWGDSYTKFAILGIKFRFTCGESDLYLNSTNGKSDLYLNSTKFQNIMTRIVAT